MNVKPDKVILNKTEVRHMEQAAGLLKLINLNLAKSFTIEQAVAAIKDGEISK